MGGKALWEKLQEGILCQVSISDQLKANLENELRLTPTMDIPNIEKLNKILKVSIKINNDPERNLTTYIPFGTPYSAIDGVMPLYDYTALQTMKMIVAGTRDLMQQLSHLSQRLKVVEKVRAFVNQAVGE
ncbi:hypothetical protein AAG906_035547 [Vitis piasezkii]